MRRINFTLLQALFCLTSRTLPRRDASRRPSILALKVCPLLITYCEGGGLHAGLVAYHGHVHEATPSLAGVDPLGGVHAGPLVRHEYVLRLTALEEVYGRLAEVKPEDGLVAKGVLKAQIPPPPSRPRLAKKAPREAEKRYHFCGQKTDAIFAPPI